jgi:signal transduction histidine kinase/CheY-like chemotaxis protein
MTGKTLIAKLTKKLPLRTVLIVPFVLQIFASVGLVGYFSYKNGQEAIANLANQLMTQVGDRVKDHLDDLINQQILIVNLTDLAFKNQELPPENLQKITDHYRIKIKYFNFLSALTYVNKFDDYLSVRRDLKNDQLYVQFASKTLNNNALKTYLLDQDGKVTKLLKTNANFQVNQRPWYQQAIKAHGQITWAGVYTYTIENNLGMAFGKAFYNQKGEYQGMFGGAFSLNQINQFLQQIQLSQKTAVFLIENNGDIVANSIKDTLFIPQSYQVKRLKINGSKNPLIQAAAQKLITKFNQLNQIKNQENLSFTFKKENYFLRVEPYRKQQEINWLIITVVPEADFMQKIYENNLTTIMLCILTLMIAIALGLLTARSITNPILKLNESAKHLAEGFWEEMVNIEREDELGELAKSFNTMANKLHKSFENLEEKIEQRTEELAIAKDKAEVANQAKSKFIASKSHELRTPLNAILGFAQLMINSTNLNSQEQRNLNIINQSGDHLLTLINNILDLAKIESGKTTVNIKNFDLYSLLDDLEDMFKLKVNNQKLSFTIEYSTDVPQYIRTDQIKLTQILINLINNAIKFTTIGGISINAISPDPDHITFSITDTGKGIAPEEINNLFQAFTQTQSGKESQEGTGLGLAISYHFVHLLGGEIKVNSQIDSGTTFSFTIKIAQVTADQIESKKPPRQVIGLAPNQPMYKILIADDKPSNRQLLIQLLNPFGFEIQEANNGEEALAIWEKWQPHLIWMDMRMPILDGYETTKIIKSTTQGNATVIIAITASVLEEDKVVTISAGCDDFVRKPFRNEMIFELLTKHLGVNFIYENSPKELPQTSTTNLKEVTEDLQAMSPPWLEELYQASIDLDEETISELIAEVPPVHIYLRNYLKDQVENYRFDNLRTLIETIKI